MINDNRYPIPDQADWQMSVVVYAYYSERPYVIVVPSALVVLVPGIPFKIHLTSPFNPSSREFHTISSIRSTGSMKPVDCESNK